MKRGKGFMNTQQKSENTSPQTGQDQTVQDMIRLGTPLTVENWLEFQFLEGEKPNPIPAELREEAKRAIAEATEQVN